MTRKLSFSLTVYLERLTLIPSFHYQELREFSIIDTDRDGYIDLEELCTHLNLPASNEISTLARIYDVQDNGRISFRDYLIGEILCSCELIKGNFICDNFFLLMHFHIHY